MTENPESDGSNFDAVKIRRTVFQALVDAASFVWGPPVAQAFFLRAPVSVHTALTSASRAEWIDAVAVRDLWVAASEGPAEDAEVFRRWIARSVAEGFGPRGELRLTAFRPLALVEHAASLWHQDHSQGHLVATSEDLNAASLKLRGHPFADDAVAVTALGIFYQRAIAMTGAANVVVEVFREPGAATLRYRWDAM